MVLQIYDVESGEIKSVLRGHMSVINCCCFNDSLQELYSGASDKNIAVWSVQVSRDDRDKDNWSDED